MPGVVEARQRPVKVSRQPSKGRETCAIWTVTGDHQLSIVADMGLDARTRIRAANRLYRDLDPTLVVRDRGTAIIIAMDCLEHVRRLEDSDRGAREMNELWAIMTWCYMDDWDRRQAWYSFNKYTGGWLRWVPNFHEVSSDGMKQRQRYPKIISWYAVRQEAEDELRQWREPWVR